MFKRAKPDHTMSDRSSQHSTDVEWEWIDSDRALEDFISDALKAESYCIDTEFHREKTYFPQLALIQIRASGRLALIDPLSVDAAKLGALFDGPRTAIVHAAQQDLDVLAQTIGVVPARIFDTQLAAGFIGYSTPSLATLVHAVTRVNLPKGDRLADWLYRPLTQSQMKYAASDVLYLDQIADFVRNELATLGRLTWAEEACEELRTRPTGNVSPADAWLRVKDVRTLKGRARWVAREVARWREERAMEINRPVRHVLSDIALLAVAQRAPRDSGELASCRGIESGFARGSQGDALLQAVRRGVAESAGGDLAFPAADGDDLDRAMRPAATLVSAWITELARQKRLDPGLLGTRRDIVDLLVGSPAARLAQGWRAEIVGRDIEDLVAGRKGLTFTPGVGVPGSPGERVPGSPGERVPGSPGESGPGLRLVDLVNEPTENEPN